MQEIWDHLVSETKKFVRGAGFSKVVLGVSGGIDSAVTAAIACEVLGSKNVLGLSMPSKHSSDSSVADADDLAHNWGFELRTTFAIYELMADTEGYLACDVIKKDAEKKCPQVRQVTHENIQARLRTVLLMAVCNEQDRLLLNTCNKSEDMVGYCTLYGDSCGATAPLGSLYKTQVYMLANWINAQDNLPNIPEAIITKEPSAELSDGQLDKDDLMPYDVLDKILVHIETGVSNIAPDLADVLDDIAKIGMVKDMIVASQFKRDQAPKPISIPSHLWYVGFEEMTMYAMCTEG